MTYQQHHRVTLDVVFSGYREKTMKAYQTLWHYFNIVLAPGWKHNFNLSEVRRLLGMPHTTFWRVIKQLRHRGEIIVSKGSGCQVERPYSNDTCSNEQSSESEPAVPSEASNPQRQLTVRREFEKGLEQNSTPGVGFGNRAPRHFQGSPKSGKSQSSAYASFLETLALEQREAFEAFCNRKVESSTFPINIPTAWLNQHHLEYWAEFERKYAHSQVRSAAPEIPQKLKDAIAAGQVNLERYFSKGEFLTGVKSLEGKGWFGSIEEWLASC